MRTNNTEEMSIRRQILEMDEGQTNGFPIRRTAYIRTLIHTVKKETGRAYSTKVDWDRAIVEIKREA